MPSSQAMMGYRTVLEIALKPVGDEPPVYVNIAELKSFTPPSFTDSEIDTTHMQSPGGVRESMPGMSDPGEASGEMNYIPGSPTDLFLLSLTRKKLLARATFPNGIVVGFPAQRRGYESQVTTEEGMTATVSLKVSGRPNQTPVTAPRNLLAPVISGSARVGLPLDLDDGIWAGAYDVTYQWKADGTPIVGATENSFVPGTGNVGDVITCEVTGANGSFSATVTTAATAAVLAA